MSILLIKYELIYGVKTIETEIIYNVNDTYKFIILINVVRHSNKR